MHRFDEQFMLREADKRMQVYETRAATNHALRQRKRSQPSLRQRLAHALIELATRLEPGSHPTSRKKGT